MEKTKMKSVASIPANYVSIIQLQERWLKEKDRKQKERENGAKLQIADGQGRREEDNVIKAMEPMVKLEEEKSNGIEKEKLGKNGGGGDSRKKKKKGENNGVQTKMQSLWINEKAKEEGENGPARWNDGRGYYRNQTHDWSSSRRAIRATKSMVWVKRDKNGVAGGGNGV